MRGMFAQMRRAGFDAGVSLNKLTAAMVDALLHLPPSLPPTKEAVVQCLGLLGQMSKTRDINAAWNKAKREVALDHSDRFGIDGKVLRRASEMNNRPSERLSAAGHRKLIALAAKENLTPDQLVAELISSWRAGRRKPR
jgi:hypothetical protein